MTDKTSIFLFMDASEQKERVAFYYAQTADDLETVWQRPASRPGDWRKSIAKRNVHDDMLSDGRTDPISESAVEGLAEEFRSFLRGVKP